MATTNLGGSFNIRGSNPQYLVNGVAIPNVTTTKEKIVKQKSDFGVFSGGSVTLDADTKYKVIDDIDLGADGLVFSQRTTIEGIESLVITLSHSGAGDLFTMTDSANRVSKLTINCPSCRVFNWSDSTGSGLLVITDMTFIGPDKFGSFTGSRSGAVASTIRVTNTSVAGIVTDGCEFFGDFFSFLWDVSAVSINAGDFFDLGTATFDNFSAIASFAILNGSSSFLRALPNSGNINAGGAGQINSLRFSGTGTPLVGGITNEDPLIDFIHNDDIADTRPDALLTLTGNTTETVITTPSVPVLVAGTWSEERSSQTTLTAAGRVTLNTGRPAILPFTASLSVEPASGTNKTIGCFFAVDGVVQTNSEVRVRADSNNPLAVTIIWQDEIDPAGFIEIYTTNETDTINVLVSNATFRVN